MTTAYTLAITKYYLQSLVDSHRIGPDDKDILGALNIPGDKKTQATGNMLPVAISCWREGRLDARSASIINKHIGNGNSIDAVLFPQIGLLKQVNGRYPHRHVALIPLIVFVSVDVNGNLSPSGTPPIIPRKWLDPAGSMDSGQTPIGSLEAVDQFCSRYPFESVASWGELHAYCEALLKHVTGTDDVIKASPEYTASSDSLLLLEPPVSGATRGIQNVLSDIIKGGKPSPLYETLVSHKARTTTPPLNVHIQYRATAHHVAQMTGEFPLSKSQRTALAHFIEDKRDGEILAINGPPGTGKTTLLRSIVGNLWVQAALKGDAAHPPIIVAASNNNQAVTNILESFARIDESGMSEELKMRWLPAVDSYGLYHCSGERTKEARNAGFSYIDSSGKGTFDSLQNSEYIDKAAPEFLAKASTWAKQEVTTIEAAKTLLHSALTRTVQSITSIHALLSNYEKEALMLEEVQKKHNEQSSQYEKHKTIAAATSTELTNEFLNTDRKWRSAVAATEDKRAAQTEFDKLVSDRSLLLTLLTWIPSVRRKTESRNRLFLGKYKIDSQGPDDASIREALHLQIEQSQKEQSHLNALRAKIIKTKERHEADTRKRKAELDQLKQQLDARQRTTKGIEGKLIAWLKEHGVTDPTCTQLRMDVESVCDCRLRFEAFKLATHYWEARWLIETWMLLSGKAAGDSKSPKQLEAKWRRFAKLTPCFVSTFYMAPSGFVGYSRNEGGWQPIPMYGAIDLLIVDESGQANPEIGSATFALAKRAVVVGDTDQIEPVWNIPATIDKANLKHVGLLQSDGQFEDFWERSGLLASNGNLMRAAQRQCRYHQYPKLQQGLYLIEHRRCYNDIIEYCNRLVYGGVLQALRGNPKTGQEPPWALMGFIHSDGDSVTTGSSRYNPKQAEDIATWLLDQRATLIAYACSKNTSLKSADQNTVLEKTVGIITPFKRQESEIRRALRNAGLPDITVGTVHKLQGDERLLVLFSSVYGANDSSRGKFYDASPNMLNVAVSRAKDSFIVFGHENIFGTSGSPTPSKLLKSKLTTVSEFESPAL